MAELLELLRQRAAEDWLIGVDCRALMQQIESLEQQCKSQLLRGQKVLLRETDPLVWTVGLAVAQAEGGQVFLTNPDWGEREWQQVEALVQPDWLLSQGQLIPVASTPSCGKASEATIQIPTGGSSGQIRFAIHTWKTLTASVQGFRQYFDWPQVNCFCTLPLYHVSGLMQLLRAGISGGRLVLMPFKSVEAGLGLTFLQGKLSPQEFAISLVPTQLQRLLACPDLAEWLAQFRLVLLGGGPAWEGLLAQARQDGIAIALTYGMTETASQVVALKPADFLAGNSSCGQVLPHARVTVRDVSGAELPPGQVGQVTIQADSLALGYYPQRWEPGVPFAVDDLGYLDEQRYLHLVGRASHKIITGGENVFPGEVEAALRGTGLVQDVCVIGMPDAVWGEAIATLYVPSDPAVTPEQIKARLQGQLSRYKWPKHWLGMAVLPRNAQGKLNQAQLRQLAREQLG